MGETLENVAGSDGTDDGSALIQEGIDAMISDDLKKSIDRIWDTLWAGGLTNPLTDVEQITYLLFMKLIDDNETRAEKNAAILGGDVIDPIFKKGVWKPEGAANGVAYDSLRWKNFCHKSPDKMLSLVREYVFPFIKTLGKGKDTAFSAFMADAVFLIPTAKVLVTLVDEISAMDLNNKDAMGDVYEELLNRVASSGTNGQFRTPRHITEMIIEMLEPTLDDTVMDPAMGSAGFLLSAISFAKKRYPQQLKKAATLKRFKSSFVNGFDTDPTMLRIGAMNLMLHGIESPSIAYRDSVSEDNTDRACCTVIAANPPFTGTIFQDSVAKDILAITKTGKTELLFLSLFVRLLKIGGRCGSIVPQGVLFGSSSAHLAIRKELVEHQRLIGVLSLPSGVFQPYSGVATAVLFFQKTDNGGTEDVWFYDMKADGRSLDQKREKIKENDIPDIINRYNEWKMRGLEGEGHPWSVELDKSIVFTDRKAKCFTVPKAEIVANNYDLSFNKYREVEQVQEDLPPVKDLVRQIEKLTADFEKGFAALKGTL